MAEFNFPTETVMLPSKGHFYAEDSPLAAGEVEIKYMTAREEDILTNQNYITNGTVLDKLLESLIVAPKFTVDDLLLGDKNALLIAARVLGYGAEYPVRIAGVDDIVNLSELDNIDIDFDNLPKGKNEFEFRLPKADTVIKFKLLTGKDEKRIEKDIEGIKKIKPDSSPAISTRLKTIITAVEGDGAAKSVGEFVDNFMLAMDSRAFRKHYKTCMPDVNMTFRSSTGIDREIPIGLSFFWPDSDL